MEKRKSLNQIGENQIEKFPREYEWIQDSTDNVTQQQNVQKLKQVRKLVTFSFFWF